MAIEETQQEREERISANTNLSVILHNERLKEAIQNLPSDLREKRDEALRLSDFRLKLYRRP